MRLAIIPPRLADKNRKLTASAEPRRSNAVSGSAVNRIERLSGKKKKVVGTNEQNAAVRHQNDLDAMKRRIKMLEERNRLLSEAVKNKEAMNASGGDDEGMDEAWGQKAWSLAWGRPTFV